MKTPTWTAFLNRFACDLDRRVPPSLTGSEYLTRWLARLVHNCPVPYLCITGPSQETSSVFWRAAQFLTAPAVEVDSLLKPGVIYNDALSWATLAVIMDTDFSEVDDIIAKKLRLLVTSPYLSIQSRTDPGRIVTNNLHFIQVAPNRRHAPYTVPVTFCHCEMDGLVELLPSLMREAALFKETLYAFYHLPLPTIV